VLVVPRMVKASHRGRRRERHLRDRKHMRHQAEAA
jgi:hypothetical protein